MNNGKREQYNPIFNHNIMDGRNDDEPRGFLEEPIIKERKQIDDWYPYVGCIYLDSIRDISKKEAAYQLKQHYKFAEYIPLNEKQELPKLEIAKIDRDIFDVQKEKMQGIKLVINAHGLAETSQMACGKKMIDALKVIAPKICKFLEQHKKAKMYIQFEPCFGACLINDGKKYEDVIQMVSELFQQYQDRIYCRCTKAGMVSNCEYRPGLEYIHLKNRCFSPQDPHTLYKMQFFPLSAWRDRFSLKYDAEKTKEIKNSLLNWTKRNKGDKCVIF